MKNILILLIFWSNQLLAQEDTLYLDKNYQLTQNKHEAFVYRCNRVIGHDSISHMTYWGQSNLLKSANLTINGAINGLRVEYNEMGKLLDSAWYEDGNYLWRYRFWNNGNLRRREFFNINDRVVIKGECFDSIGRIIPYYDFEIMPVFNGDLFKFISDNITYPRQARKQNIEGRVVSQFIIMQDGSMSDIVILSSPDKLLSDATIEMLKKMPLWIPGLQEGEPVNVRYTLPVDFKLY